MVFHYFVRCDGCGIEKAFNFDNHEKIIQELIKEEWIFKPYSDKSNIHFCSLKCKLNYEKELVMCADCEWEENLDVCKDILDDLENEWCFDTITGIKKWVEENEHITEKQINAIENIQSAIERRNDF